MNSGSEDEVDEMEELLQKHRKEKKELQAKIQALKKSASKGDKKKKKEVTEEINRLEDEMNQRHESEVSELKEKILQTTIEPSSSFSGTANGHTTPQRISKAQKRRDKKVTQLKERELRILEQDMSNLHGPRHVETEEIKRILKERGLMISEVPSDGDCLYNAIIKRMRELDENNPTMKELRSQTAEFLRNNLMEFLPYLSHPDTGNMLTESQYAEYCDQVADKAWGGQIELRALSQVLKRPLEVIQAKGPPVISGEEHKETGSPPIILTYHRHMYGLGEHYNTVTQFKDENEEEFS